MTVVYAVRVEFPDPAVREPYLAWITGGHAAEVVAAGASSAEVIALRDGSLEVRYHFADQAALSAYESGPAVALRAEGVRRFPAEAVVATRTVGDVVTRI